MLYLRLIVGRKSFITDLRVDNFIRVPILYTVSLFLLSLSRLNLVLDIGSGSTQSYASLCSVLLLLGSFCHVLVGHLSLIHLTTYDIAELGKQTCLWP